MQLHKNLLIRIREYFVRVSICVSRVIRQFFAIALLFNDIFQLSVLLLSPFITGVVDFNSHLFEVYREMGVFVRVVEVMGPLNVDLAARVKLDEFEEVAQLFQLALDIKYAAAFSLFCYEPNLVEGCP